MNKTLTPFLVLLLASAATSACRTPPDDALFAPCAEAKGQDSMLFLQGTDDLSDIEITSTSASAEVITTGDYVRAARVTDSAAVEVEALLVAREELAFGAGYYNTNGEDARLLELSVELFADDRHFEGTGYLDLADERPYWLAVFAINQVTEGYASQAIERNGTLSGCLVARSPDAPPPIKPPPPIRLQPTPTP